MAFFYGTIHLKGAYNLFLTLYVRIMVVLKCNINDISDSDYKKYFSLMSAEKQIRIKKFKFSDDKKRSIAGEMLVKEYISETYGLSAESTNISIGANGKPYIENSPVYFNISHSGDMVVCAFDKNPIGIDVEKIKNIDLKIGKRVFCDKELQYLFGHSAPFDFTKTADKEILIRFFELWTVKEAYLKFKGIGIAIDLKNLNIDRKNVKAEIFNDYVISVYTETINN